MSIAYINPEGWDEDNQVHCLRPWEFMLSQYKRGHLTAIGYEQRYRECVLSQVSPQFILDYYDNSILVCYEKPEDFCHRHIVRDWIREKTGVVIDELDFVDANYKVQIKQQNPTIATEQLSFL